MENLLNIITVVVTLTAAVIGATCGLTLKWISSMCNDMSSMKARFETFVDMYWKKQSSTHDDCVARHAKIDTMLANIHRKIGMPEVGDDTTIS